MNGKRKIIIGIVLATLILGILGTGAYYWYENEYFVSTEDAKVTGDIIKVSPQIAGKLLEFRGKEGEQVGKGQLLGRQEMVNIPDSSLEIAAIRAPIKGVILKEQANVGEVLSPGQPLAMLVDPDSLYVNANIEETKIGRIKPTQEVEVTIDQFPGKVFTGKVESLGEATSATFSLLPSSTGGNFTKIIQKIPVKISLDKTNLKLIPGTSAVVRIHIR